jgi:hypothetical protein
VHYLDFEGGSGVAFVTGFSDEASPITSSNASYVFQGLTQDGQSYVSLFWPIANDILPGETLAQMSDSSVYDAFVNQFDSYVTRTTAQLNAQTPNSFTPDHSLLHSMLRTLHVGR